MCRMYSWAGDPGGLCCQVHVRLLLLHSHCRSPVQQPAGHWRHDCGNCMAKIPQLNAQSLYAGEAPCIMTYFVRNYWELLFLRLLTGISLGGIFPLVRFNCLMLALSDEQSLVKVVFIGQATCSMHVM